MAKIEKINQAVILAGGLGARLMPLTKDTPKPMVVVGDKPFIEHLLEMLKKNDITDIVMLLGYLPEKFMDYFGDGSRFGLKIQYSVGDIEDETGTRIRNAKGLLQKKFFLLYGDNYWPMQKGKMIEHYNRVEASTLVTVYKNLDARGEYGEKNNMTVAGDGFVTCYDKSLTDPTLNGTDIGFYILDKKLISDMPNDNFSFEKTMLPRLIKEKQLSGYMADHLYFPLTSIEWMKKMEKFFEPKKITMLDRDGVINKKMPEHDYVKKWEEFEFLPGSIEALKTLKNKGHDIYVVSNQRGISRGLMTEDDLAEIHEKMNIELEKHGINLSGIYHCSHGNDDNCLCRKPKPGMLFKAANDNSFDLTKAVFIGDSKADIEAGINAGCRTIKVSSEKGLSEAINLFS